MNDQLKTLSDCQEFRVIIEEADENIYASLLLHCGVGK